MLRSDRAVPKSFSSFLRYAPLGLLLAVSVPGFAHGSAGPPDPGSGGRPEEPASEQASRRAEQEVARMLARLDESLDLGTFPDGSPDWPARLAASIESRTDGEEARELLRQLAVELRGLRIDWSLGGPPDERPDGRPTASSPAGRERVERIQRIRELVELVNSKHGLPGADAETEEDPRESRRARKGEATPSSPDRIAPKYGSDSCAAAAWLSQGETYGYTYGTSNDGGASCAGPTPTPDVWYTFTPGLTGTYTFKTVDHSFYDIFDTVLSLHSGCPLPGGDNQELACSDDAGPSLLSSISYPLTAGQPVWVRVSGYGGATGEYLLNVSLDRTIRGKVTREDTGSPIAGATVEILTWWGGLVSKTTSGSDGSYAAGAPAESELYARARDPGFVSEVYDDYECPFPSSCHTSSGDPISVISGDASGIDFTLEPAGSISGSITAADTAEPPLDSSDVYVYRQDGTYVGSIGANNLTGTFEILSLLPGTYFLRASSYGYQDEVWNGVACPHPCDPTSGSAVIVTAGMETSGIDFELDRLGKIQGVVTLEGAATPIVSESISVYDANGDWAGSGYTLSDGSYEVAHLEAGDHFARTSTFDHVDELYDDLPCEPSCTATAGTPIPVQLNVPVSGIDFALVRKGIISGTLIDADTGEPVSAEVYLHNLSGTLLRSQWTGWTSGEYDFYGLDQTQYFVRAGFPSWRDPTHEGELYDDLPCEPDCDVTAGTPVEALNGSETTGIDFVLDRRGWISGTVLDDGTGQPIADLLVQAFRLDGTAVPFGYGHTAADGRFEIRSLAAGSYRVGTSSGLYRNEMYDGVVCAVPCDRTAGSQITVQTKLETPGIDFGLTRLGSISGRVVDAASGAVLSSIVSLLDADGDTVVTAEAYSGSYLLTGLQPGTYYVRAREDSWEPPYQDEVYPDVPCQPDCEVSEGTPIVIAFGSIVTGIDLALARCPAESRLDVASTTIGSYTKLLACDRVSAGDVLLTSGADLLLKSGRSVVLGEGFRMDPGARLQVVIEPAWSDD